MLLLTSLSALMPLPKELERVPTSIFPLCLNKHGQEGLSPSPFPSIYCPAADRCHIYSLLSEVILHFYS